MPRIYETTLKHLHHCIENIFLWFEECGLLYFQFEQDGYVIMY